MRRLLITVLALAVVIGAVTPLGPVQAQALDPEQTVSAFYIAFNAGDAETTASLYAEDAYVDLTSDDIYSGSEEIRAWIDDEIAVGGQVDYEILEVDGGYVTAYTSYTDGSSSTPIEAVEEFVIEDGLITAHTWTPTDAGLEEISESMSDIPIALYGRYGVIGEGSFYVTNTNTDQEVEIPANFVGILNADGEGNVEGIRMLNGTSVYADSVVGVYTEGIEGSLTFTLEAYIDGEDTVNAQEEWVCFITDDGEFFQCIMTAYVAALEGGGVQQIRVVASIEGTRMGELQ